MKKPHKKILIKKTNELNQQHKQQEKEKPMVTGQVPYFWKHLDNKNHKNAENELDARNNFLNDKPRLNDQEISEKAHVVYQRSQNLNKSFSSLFASPNPKEVLKEAKRDTKTIMDNVNVKQLFSIIYDINDTAKLILQNNTLKNKRSFVRKIIALKIWCEQNASSLKLTTDVCKFFKSGNLQFIDSNGNVNMQFMNQKNKEILIQMFTPYIAFYNRFSTTSKSQNKIKNLLEMTQSEFNMEMQKFKEKMPSVPKNTVKRWQIKKR